MATFYNQATLIFGGSETNSNITEGQILGGADVSKIALSRDYGKGDGINYAISLVNNGAAVSNITLTDNLGEFTPDGFAAPVVPLTYVDNSLLYYVNGIITEAPDALVTDDGLVISGINIPANSNALIIYEARANEFAPLSSGSSVTNTVMLGGNTTLDEVTASATVPVRDFTNLTIAKAVYPEIATDNSEITYIFIIQNTGNTPAAATDNVIIRDTFTPILNPITVTLNGENLTEGTQYTYDVTTGDFTTIGGAVPVPAATFTRDPVSGAVSTTPGVAILKIIGTI